MSSSEQLGLSLPAPSTHLVPNRCSVAVLFLLPTRPQSDVHQITWLGVGFYIHVHWGRWGGSPMPLFLGVINCTRRRSRWISLVQISGCQSLRSTVNLRRGAWSHRVLDKETLYKVPTLRLGLSQGVRRGMGSQDVTPCAVSRGQQKHMFTSVL